MEYYLVPDIDTMVISGGQPQSTIASYLWSGTALLNGLIHLSPWVNSQSDLIHRAALNEVATRVAMDTD